MSLSDDQNLESSPNGFGCGDVGGNSYGCGWGSLGGEGIGDGIGFACYGENRGDGVIYGYSNGSSPSAPKLFISGLAMSGPAFDDLIRHAVLTSCI